MRKQTKWITYTAMGIALVIVAQYLGSFIPGIAVIFGPFSVKQLIIGTLVNCALLVFTAQTGVSSGVTIGIVSAILAALIGISQIVISPLVAVGNALLCIIYRLLKEKIRHLPSAAVGAAVKCAFLWLTVPALLAAVGFPEKQAAVLSVMFSWPQGITALCGGLLSWPIISRIKTATGNG